MTYFHVRDTKVSMLLSLLLASIRILSCLFVLFFVMLCYVVKEKIKVKLAFAIPTSAPTMLVIEMIDTPPYTALKTIKILSV